MLIIRNNKKPIQLVTSKDIYSSLITKKAKPPTSLDTWTDTYPFMININWKTLFTIPYKIIKEPYLQSFQFKILHRIINCGEKLYQWKIVNDDKCNYCTESIDTIEHHFFYCPESKLFWNRVEEWMKSNIEIEYNFTVCEVIFGIPFKVNHIALQIINFILLLGKWYMNKIKTEGKVLYFISFLELLSEKIHIITNINKINSCPNKVWQDTLKNIL